MVLSPNSGRVLTGAIAEEPTVRKAQRLYRPIINKNSGITLRKAKSGQRINPNGQVNLSRILPELQTERDKRLRSPEWEEFNIDNGSKYRVRYARDNYGRPIYQVDKYLNMEGTNQKSGWGSDLGGGLLEYYAEGNNSDIYRNNWLKNKYTSENGVIKSDMFKYFWPKKSPYNMSYNQK